MGLTQALTAGIQGRGREYAALSDSIWEKPETAFQETFASGSLIAFLKGQGFQIETSAGGLETAFVARFGTPGGPAIGILGEYDALPGLSQAAGLTHRRELQAGGPGHGCGHNLLGVGSAAAAVAIKEYLEQAGIAGEVRYYGCPAEESGCGKGILVRAGLFDDVDACLTWHPGNVNHVVAVPYLANISMSIRFLGKAAHAAMAPEEGRSALDACELMNVGSNYMREHTSTKVRYHYSYTGNCTHMPNTVPDAAGLLYYIRAPRISEAREVARRLKKVARGAALMTETRLACRVESEMYDYLPNHTLGAVMDAAFREIGGPRFTQEDQDAAAGYQTASGTHPPLAEDILPYTPNGSILPISSDVGNVSYRVPTVQLYACCFGRETQYHTWQMVAQMKTPAAHRGMLTAAQVIALTGVRLLGMPALLREAKEELRLNVENRCIPQKAAAKACDGVLG